MRNLTANSFLHDLPFNKKYMQTIHNSSTFQSDDPMLATVRRRTLEGVTGNLLPARLTDHIVVHALQRLASNT